MLDIKLFSKYYSVLAARFPAIAINQDLTEMYYEILSEELNDYQLPIAIKNIIRDCEFFPSPKQIIEAAPSVESLLLVEMDRLELPPYIPADWRERLGKTFISELTIAQKQEYLAHVQQLQPAIAPAKPCP